MGKCEQEGCNINAYFNVKGGKGRFCNKHKTAEMINVIINRCEADRCDIEPVFDIKGGKGRFCLSHKTTEMVNIR